METWLPIAGYEGVYDVSDQGRVRRVTPDGTGRLLTPVRMQIGYCKVTLSKDGVKKQHYIHQLVCTAFHPNPDHLPVVHHRDNDGTHNYATNLTWSTQEMNLEHSLYVAGRPSRLKLAQVEKMRKLYSTRQYSQKQLGEMFGVGQSQVSHVVRGICYKHAPGARKPFTRVEEVEQTTDEQWKTHPDYPAYMVSNYGEIRRQLPGKGTYPGRILKLSTNNSGYPYTQLADVHGQFVPALTHRLVAELFVPPFKGETVHHRNGNKQDPRAANLEWVTGLVNTQRGAGHN